jgi:AcrR family transcriptional regulator
MPKIVDRDRYRQELLTHCFDLFAQKGYGSLTMRQIAKELGVSTGTLYHYFPSKEALFVQLIEEITEQDILNIRDGIEKLATVEERIALVSQYIIENEEYFYKQTLLYFNFFQQPALEQERLKEAIQQSIQRYQKAIMDYLKIENRAIAEHIFYFLDGLMSNRAFTPELVDIQQQMDLLSKIITVYLKSSES